MQPEPLTSDEECLARAWEGVTTRLERLKPSEWAEKHRYLPAASSPRPGPYRFKVAPYLREIVDCLGVDSPVREVSFMKGVQIGATVGVLENYVGYLIGFVRRSPAMLLTADSELSGIRFNTSIVPMIQLSGLDELVRSHDERNARKTGRTEQRVEWDGGGFMLLAGAKNPDKLRSIPIEALLRDEVDAYATNVGKDGDPMKLSADRTAAYERTRKILNISTPLIRGQSNIEACFRRGDQRRFFVRCLKCDAQQTLRWRRENRETGEITGFVWETQGDLLVPESVRYLCKECAHPHTEYDKPRLIANGEWQPTAVPADPHHRSYHLSALYSLLQSWATAAAKWLEAWDPTRNQPRDNAKLQVFYNNQLGEPYRMFGASVRYDVVTGHKRDAYHYGQIPNRFAEKYCGSVVLALVCTVDVHKDNLAVSVWGWTVGRRALLVDYWRFEGETEDIHDPETWGRLATLIEDHRYVADDGKRYQVALTLIDSGYRADDVYQFCAQYESLVYPVKGRDMPPRSANLKEFSEFASTLGTPAFSITVDFYKARLAGSLRREWDGVGLQPEGHFNAPTDATPAQLKELTVETQREKVDPETGQSLGFAWHRPSGSANELWDCFVYASAGFDMLAWDHCVRQLEMESVNWPVFHEAAVTEKLFFDV
jgi:terminase, large subunit